MNGVLKISQPKVAVAEKKKNKDQEPTVFLTAAPGHAGQQPHNNASGSRLF